jgi:hypothetical protein
VVFGAYSSLKVIEDAHRDHGLPPWSIVVVDEAHRTPDRRSLVVHEKLQVTGHGWGFRHPQADDAAGADLLGSIRRYDEELLQTLGDNLPKQAAAVVAAANSGRGGAEWVGSTGAGEAVRSGWSRLREAVEESGRQAEHAARSSTCTTSRPGRRQAICGPA